MEAELQMTSCLFGGPPVRDDLIKLGESQIGFMNIFARPLFEAVADILPDMRYVVEEILTNKAIWEKKIEDERTKKKKKPNFSLGLLPPSFNVDPTPSPFSGGPLKPPVEARVLPPSQLGRSMQSPTQINHVEESGRRGSSGSAQGVLSSSRRSSGADKGSRRSSGAGIPCARSRENQSQSRRGSADASLTAILVTQTPNAPDASGNEVNHESEQRSKSPGNRKDTLTKSSPKKEKEKKEKESPRPVTAPSSARRSQGKISSPHNPSFYRSSRPLGVGPDFDSATNLFPVPKRSSQSYSEVDLSNTANGNLDGSKAQQWETNKVSGDSGMSRSDGARDSPRRNEWWRGMSSRRRTRDLRNGDREVTPQPKEVTLDPSTTNSTSDANSPTATSPGRTSRTGKLRSFFKRKTRNSNDQEKQLSSFGSSSQLRTPPTSDPGHSLNSATSE